MKRYAVLILLIPIIGLTYPIIEQEKTDGAAQSTCKNKSSVSEIPNMPLSRLSLAHRTTENVPTICNNPGALRMTSSKRINDLAIGYYQTKGNGKFLVFGTPQDGYLALKYLLEDYGESTMFSFIKRYAPKIENDTDEYLKDLCKGLGVTSNTKVRDCNQMALMSTIAKIEGFKE